MKCALWMLLAGAALILIGASAVIAPDPRLLWNPSQSAPIGLYRVTPIDTLEVGALVAVRPTPELESWLIENSYIGRDTPLLKRIAALPDDEVCREGATIIIEGAPVAEARERDRLDRPLPAWSGCRVLIAGEVFLLNTEHSASLDGRYFGPLGSDTILGRAKPLWTREPDR